VQRLRRRTRLSSNYKGFPVCLLRIVGIYTLVSSVVGVIAFPKSPFWALLLLSPLLIAAGYGLLL
jgi:membrane glycosyltransferase